MIDEDRKADILDHITRQRLPWRATEPTTECGRDADKVPQVIDADTYRARIKNLGQRRTALTVCQTCADRAEYSRPWAVDPIGLLHRELQRVGIYRYDPDLPESSRARLITELRALAALAEAHPDEFSGYLDGLDHTVSLDAHRAKRRRPRQ